MKKESRFRGSFAVVTGGAGFIGGQHCLKILEEGGSVLCVDDLSTGRRDTVERLMDGFPKRFLFVYGDVAEEETERKAECAAREGFRGEGYVFHLASPASVRKEQERPVRTIRTNTVGTERMLRMAWRHGARFVFASTSCVYGDPVVFPQAETYTGNVDPVSVRACYDEAKRCGEAICYAYEREWGMPVRVVRIFNTYGPGAAAGDDRAVPMFVTQAVRLSESVRPGSSKRGALQSIAPEGVRKLSVHGNGEQTRSFCYVSDMVEGIVRAALLEGHPLTPINLGNPEEVRIVDLACRIVALVGLPGPPSQWVEYTDRPEDDPRGRVPDIRRARELLGWEPRVSLDEGLKRTIEAARKGRTGRKGKTA